MLFAAAGKPFFSVIPAPHAFLRKQEWGGMTILFFSLNTPLKTAGYLISPEYLAVALVELYHLLHAVSSCITLILVN